MRMILTTFTQLFREYQDSGLNVLDFVQTKALLLHPSSTGGRSFSKATRRSSLNTLFRYCLILAIQATGKNGHIPSLSLAQIKPKFEPL